MSPTCIFIGPDKSGSSWLYEFCKWHPNCFVPVEKDLYFFDKYYDRGLGWYRRKFNGADQYKCSIDISHDYLFSKVAADRIRDYSDDVKLMTFIRNPVDRSISQFLYMRRVGLVGDDFYEAILKYPQIIDNSCFFKHLSNYREFLKEGRVGVFLFDDLMKSPVDFSKAICGWIGVNFLDGYDYSRRIRGEAQSRSRFLIKPLKKLAVLMRDVGLERALGVLKNSEYVDGLLYKKIENKSELLAEVDKNKVYHDFFKDDVQCLEALLGVDLSGWKY